MDRMVEHYFKRREQLIKTFVLIDSKIGVTKIDEQIINFLKYANRSFFIVATKKDKSKQSEIHRTTLQIKKHTTDFLFISSFKKININKLSQIIDDCFKKS
jgi:GTP-binding protein